MQGGGCIPRPQKCRKVCSLPHCTDFGPAHKSCAQVEMTVDEYETIRLIDLEGLTQEQCAERMEVARTTAQAIYAAARKKLAECLVKGSRLKIGGGNVEYCEHHGHACGHGCRHRGEKRADAPPEKG